MNKTFRLLLAFFAFLLRSGVTNADEGAQIDYLACDWGPSMTLPGKTNESPRFSETEEEVYFLKQLTRFQKTAASLQSKGTSIYLCKMKPDGTAKTEIKELWRDVAFPIDTQGQTTWLDVNEKTKQIALAIGFAGTDIVGLWVVNMDGSGLKRIVTERTEEKRLRAITSCSWTPDGQWIVFEEEQRGTKPDNLHNIARCDARGAQFQRLLTSDGKQQYRHSTVSPDGHTIAFTKHPEGYPGQCWIWLMDRDGGNSRPLGGKQTLQTWGSHPAWNPDGSKLFGLGVSSYILDVSTGERDITRSPQLDGRRGVCGWPHWGRRGFVGFNSGGILVTDPELKTAKWIAASGKVAPTSHSENEW